MSNAWNLASGRFLILNFSPLTKEKEGIIFYYHVIFSFIKAYAHISV